MKKKVIIHIGLHKTASTFIQTHLLPTFPETTLLTRPFTQFNRAFNKLQYADDTLYDKKEVEAVINQIKHQRIILSDENFSGKLFFYNSINRSQTARRLHELFPEATIVVVVRNQLDFIKSSYNHYIKGVHRGKKAIHKFIKYSSESYNNYELHPANARVDNYMDYLYYNTDDTSINMEVLKYSKLLLLYKSLFSKVKVVLYEDIIQNPKSIVKTFEDELGVNSKFDINTFKTKENVSLTQADLYVQLKINQKNSNNKVLKKLYKEYFKLNKKSLLGLDENSIKEYFKEDNKIISEIFPETKLERYKEKYF